MMITMVVMVMVILTLLLMLLIMIIRMRVKMKMKMNMRMKTKMKMSMRLMTKITIIRKYRLNKRRKKTNQNAFQTKMHYSAKPRPARPEAQAPS